MSPVEYTGDAAKIVAILQPVWGILPSPEARAKMNPSSNSSGVRFRTGSPTAGPTSPRANGAGGAGASISDMDVRSLKTLYTPAAAAPNGSGGAPGVGAFTVEAFAARVPSGRYGRPEEVADLVAYLLSPGSSYISGSAIPIDCGWTAQ